MSNPTDLIRRLADEVEADPDRIWLQPACCATYDVGRLWCHHDEPVECEDGRPWAEYVRVMPGQPHWWVIRDEDGEIVVGGTREEMEGYARAAEGRTLHGVYVGPAVEAGDHA